MRRPAVTWIIFSVCLVVLLTAMAWVTKEVLRLDRAQAEASRRAAHEERVRLALWRMDSAVAPIIAQENARPYFQYAPFYPADRAYGRMFSAILPGETLLPSPLLTSEIPYVLAHFQIDPEGRLSSPQVPSGEMRRLAVRAGIDQTRMERSANRLRIVSAIVPQVVALSSPVARPERPTAVRAEKQAPRTPMVSPERTGATPGDRQAPSAPVASRQGVENASPEKAQQELSDREFGARVSQQAMLNEELLRQNTIVITPPAPQKSEKQTSEQQVPQPPPMIEQGPLQAFWIGDALVLARQVWVEDGRYIQGCSLDWPALQGRLLESVRNLLPNAALRPAGPGSYPRPGVSLAAVPVLLVPGAPFAEDDGSGRLLRTSLALAWMCVLIATGAAAFLLQQALSLSERRGAFVSAVTHELRTPLTTFRMYAEMLAEGMAPEKKDRDEFLRTLVNEAERLDHLVRNVLAYARLDGAGKPTAREDVTVASLLARPEERLRKRAREAGLELKVEIDSTAGESNVNVDVAAVEQILFNLVDNAAKYARAGENRSLDLSAGIDRSHLFITVRDYGPGLSREQRRRLFRPFSKSVAEAARSAPGVGLGLALSRRLARALGGDLRLNDVVEPGACFVLRLPRGVS